MVLVNDLVVTLFERVSSTARHFCGMSLEVGG